MPVWPIWSCIGSVGLSLTEPVRGGGVSIVMVEIQRIWGVWTLGVGLLAAAMPMPVIAADLLDHVEGVYQERQLRRTLFDPRTAELVVPTELRFLEDLFSLTDEASLLNANVGRWFSSDGVRGLHAADYQERMGALRAAVERLDTPERVTSVRNLISESLTLQAAFLNEWFEAREVGKPFESQLTDEYAYHEGLHRSHRLILKAFAELRALFPNIGESAHRAFLDHLRAMDLV